MAQQTLQSSLVFRGTPLYSEDERGEFLTRIAAAKSFLETAQANNIPGKLKDFNVETAIIQQHQAAF
jgi:hypothetical protein